MVPRRRLSLPPAPAIDPRYAREWLEQQAVGGVLAVDDVGAAPERATVHAAGRPRRGAARARQPELSRLRRPVAAGPRPGDAEAAGSVSDRWRRLAGPTTARTRREGQAEQNRPIFLNLLGSEWLPKVADVHARLSADPPARVADIGCGVGWSSIALARAYSERSGGRPRSGRAFGRHRPTRMRPSTASPTGCRSRCATWPIRPWPAATTWSWASRCSTTSVEPVEVLRNMRRLLADGGAVIIMDEKVAETFTAPGDDDGAVFLRLQHALLPAGRAWPTSHRQGPAR